MVDIDNMAVKKNIEKLVLVLDGDRISSMRFLKATENFFAMLRTVGDEAAGQKDALNWMVSVKKGSLQVIAYPEVNRAPKRFIRKTVNAIENGIAKLEIKSERPPFFNDHALGNLKELASVITDAESNVQKIKVRRSHSVRTISKNTLININEILGIARKERGSVEGRVAFISDRKSLKVYVDDQITGHGVRCIIKKSESEEILISSFRRRVLVTGVVHYAKNGEPKNIEVDHIRLLGKSEDLPGFDDVIGIYQES